jgi:hypothetical protein
MDLLRTCYTHKVFWDNSKTRSSKIIWYRASDNADFFPYPHVFSSERYDTIHWFNDGAGEDELSGPTYYKGMPPARFTGQNFCGDPSWFLGAPSDAPPLELDENGWPVCCNIEESYYASRPAPSSPSAPPSFPACPDCLEGISPAVMKVTFGGTFTGTICHGFGGTFLLENNFGCHWQTTVVIQGVTYNLELSLNSFDLFCGIQGLFSFVPNNSPPFDCFAVQHWTPSFGPVFCDNVFATCTSQPG